MIDIIIENINNYKNDKKHSIKQDVLNLCGPKVLTKLIENNNYNDVIKVSNKDKLKYIRYSFIRNHHKYYKDYTKFNEPLIK